MFAFIALDHDGTEGVIAGETPMGFLPLVGADMDRIDSLRPIAQRIALGTKTKVCLVQFTNRIELEPDILAGKED